jgi:hypothetical protein
MDPAGADALKFRLEQQQHWLTADAVRDGLQPRVDPHLAALQEFGGNERLYDDRDGAFAKQLLDGNWTRVEMADRLDPHRAPAHAGAA